MQFISEMSGCSIWKHNFEIMYVLVHSYSFPSPPLPALEAYIPSTFFFFFFNVDFPLEVALPKTVHFNDFALLKCFVNSN